MNAPLTDDDQPLRDALQRDAARISERPFDATLHQATMRRIRALSATEAQTSWFASWPMLASAAAVVAAIVTVALWPSHPSSNSVPATAIAAVVPAPPRASILAYQVATNEGDAALFATLDHDAADLLPASSPVFNALQ